MYRSKLIKQYDKAAGKSGRLLFFPYHAIGAIKKEDVMRNQKRAIFSTGLVVFFVIFTVSPLFSAEKWTEQWKKVNEAVKKGLPKTAIKCLDPIIKGAIEEKAYGEAIKAIGMKMVAHGNIQGNKPEEKIWRLEAEIEKAPAEMRPLMEAVLANWYWHYFQRNRWRFMQRTRTETSPGDDITTWDLPRIFAEISTHFEKALAASDLLKRTPVSEYDALLEKGSMPDTYRPTLYDFIAYEALGFYASGEQAGARPQDAFSLGASTPVFSPAAHFVSWKIKTATPDAPEVKALKLYQELLRFHADDEDRSAWLDVNLHRLTFGYNKAFGEEKKARYKAALKHLESLCPDHPISARVLYHRANVFHAENNFVKAHELARQGTKRFPKSVGGRQCHNLIERIEAQELQVSAERVWNVPFGTIDVTYRNLTAVYFRIVPYDWERWLTTHNRVPTWLNRNQRAELLQREPELAWSETLPPTEDYQKRVKQCPIPQDIAPGSYFLIASGNKEFSEVDNQVFFTTFWFSTLSLVVRSRNGENDLSGFVLDAQSGTPVEGATVQAWRNQRSWKKSSKAETDANGIFSLKGLNRDQYLLHVTYENQELAAQNQYYLYDRNRSSRVPERTIFFTDRSIYRPGQTVHYKGICIRFDKNENNYTVLTGEDLTVIFADANNKEIDRLRCRTNDYGSFSGSFTAPRDRLTGRMRIYVHGGPSGSTFLNVEEYKRPKFRVTVAPPEEAAKLAAPVTVKGTATAYTGASIGGADVRWRVVREVQYPPWWGWYYWWRTPRGDSQEIANGRATTAADGTFSITFTAHPDQKIPEKEEPVFRFTVYADVTDTAGETRSARRTVNVGYTALKASITAADWQTVALPVSLTINTTSLDGEPVTAEGVLKVYKLKQPEKVMRKKLATYYHYWWYRREGPPESDPSNPHSWPLGELVKELGFTTDAAGSVVKHINLEAGPYRVLLETQDRYGKPVKARLPLTVVDTKADAFTMKVPDHFSAPSWSAAPGETFTAFWGTGYKQGRAYIEVEHRNRVVQSCWSEPGKTQVQIKQKVNEFMRGGFIVRVTFVRENRCYLHTKKVSVPWTNKNLSIRWEHFVSKLTPAEKETWTAVITGPDAEKAVAEMVATLYDASLDAYKKHRFLRRFNCFYQDSSNLQSVFENRLYTLRHILGSWKRDYKQAGVTYRSYPDSFSQRLYGHYINGISGGEGAALGARRRGMAVPQENAMSFGKEEVRKSATIQLEAKDVRPGAAAGEKAEMPQEQEESIDLDKVTARKNLDETAFFFPHLLSNKEGEVKLTFTMPEALTEWKFFGFAHGRSLRSGFLEATAVTSKDLMVQPNPPRFLREGDVLAFTVKVTNQSPARQEGRVRLTFEDARTGACVDGKLGNTKTDLAFDIPSKESRTCSWKLTVPDGTGFLKYKAVGSTSRLSDGEEGLLPVLSRRIFVTESLPLPVRDKQTKKFTFAKLLESGKSKTLEHKGLVVQMVSNPAWYAVMALPYLMEYPHQCSEQVFNRLYANALARFIASSDPKIRNVFNQWKGTDALDSPLEKNEDLKQVILEETPWVRQAASESRARRNVGILFDQNRLDRETERTLFQLTKMQRADGAWPWFPGGLSNDYITLYITTGFGRLRHLGVDITVAPAVKSLKRLDAWIDRIYRDILARGDKDKCHLSHTIALYLYGRSFFLGDAKIDAKHKEAVDYFLDQARKYWLKLGSRQSKAHLALALKRFGDRKTAEGIMKSIKEHSVTDDELGMFWRDQEVSWWWYRAPIETQAMMIEAFDEVMNDKKAVEDCRVWLLKQKQTQDWKTTKATADAVYGLLLRGTDRLASDVLVEVALGGRTIEPEKVEAGTGFYEERFDGAEVTPEFGRITVTKRDKGVSWGSVHWQYMEDMKKVTPHTGTPLTLEKKLYIKEFTEKGPVLKAVSGSLHPGDELVVRIVLRTDRDMEYVHLKDHRGSGTEPVNVLSRYKYQDGLRYYEATGDTASHFFIDYLPKGAYVFEYAARIVHRGTYQTGMAQVQCMYAPEFNSHSEGFELQVE